MLFPPGFSVRDAEPAKIGTCLEVHRRSMLPITINVDRMGTLPEH